MAKTTAHSTVGVRVGVALLPLLQLARLAEFLFEIEAQLLLLPWCLVGYLLLLMLLLLGSWLVLPNPHPHL